MKRYILIIIFLFSLVAPQVLLSQEKKEKVEVSEEMLPELSVVDNVLYVKNAPIGSTIEIITIVGNKVHEIELKSRESSYQLNLPKAIYIFKLNGVVRKFVIK